MRTRMRDLHSAIVETQKRGRRPSLRLSLGVAVGLVSMIGVSLVETVFAEASPAITVLVDNYAHASPAIMAGAEREAGRILGKAGLRAVWLECPVGPSTASPQGPCQKGPEATDIRLRVLAASIQNKFQDNVFGFTVHPVLASVYYGHALRRAKNDDAEFEVPIILGCVIAHEIGHLLLGSNGHSSTGIMQPRWEPKQFRLTQMGGLLFTSQQATLIRAEARRRTTLQKGTLEEQALATVDKRAEPEVIPQSD